MRLFCALSMLLLFPFTALAGPSISGGADNCGSEAFLYRCTVSSDNGDGTVWKQSYEVSRDAISPAPIERLSIGICDIEQTRHAWITLASRKDPSMSASAQTEFPKKQKSFNLFVSLNEGSDYSGSSYYFMECKKIH